MLCRLVVTLWTTAHQAPLSMEFARQEYWSRWPFPSPRDLPDPEIKLRSPTLHVSLNLLVHPPHPLAIVSVLSTYVNSIFASLHL